MVQQQEILRLLQSQDPDEVREGAYQAGKEKVESAIPFLVKQVASGNTGVQEAVERALERIGGMDVLHAMLPLLRSDDSPVRNIAMDLLRKVGSNDVQTLCDMLHDDDPDIRIFIADILGSCGSLLAVAPLCASLLRDLEVNVRYQAGISLGQLGFVEAESCLIKGMRDEEWVQFAVIDALAKIRSEAAVAALSKSLDSSSDLVASMIVEALGVVGNIKSVPLLIKHLDKSPTALCNKIIKAVVNILSGPSINLLGNKEGERLRGYMLTALSDEDAEVQDAAISGLAYLGGSDAFSAIFGIAKKLNPDMEHDRYMRIVTRLASFGYDAALEEAFANRKDEDAITAVAVMSQIVDPRVIEILKKYFWSQTRDIQRAMIVDLADKAGREEQDFFVDVLGKHDDGSIIKSALLFLGQYGDPVLMAPKLMAALDHPYPDVKEVALHACIALHLPEINQHFREMLASSDLMTRMMAVYGLGQYSLTENEDLLFGALLDAEPDIRKLAIEALGSVCPISQERLDKILPCINDEYKEVRLTIIDVLSACLDESLLEPLKAGLKDPDPWVRARCVENIGRYRQDDTASLITELLYDENQLVVIKAVEALAGIGGEVAFRALLPLVDHAEPEVQRVVEEAVAKIRQEAGV